jgi:hypothetical protein
MLAFKEEKQRRFRMGSNASSDWLFQNLTSCYKSSMEEHGPYEYQFRICDQTIQFCFAEPNLAGQLTRAFAHLRQPLTAAPDCTVAVGQARSSFRYPSIVLKAYLTALESSWWDLTNHRGELLEMHNPPTMAAYYPGTSGLSMLDCESGQGLYWKTGHTHVPYYEVGDPFRTLLHWWLRSRGFQFVHGAGVGFDTGAALLVGKGGAGKSTSAVASIRGGLQYAGDDYCVVGLDPQPVVYSLYNTCKLCGDDDIARFPGLAGHVSNPARLSEEKALVFLHELLPDRVRASLPLKCLLVPKITGSRDTLIRPCKGMEALSAIVPWTMAQLPSSNHSDVKFMSALVRRLPTFSIELGTQVEQIPEVIARLLEQLA